MVTTHNGLIGQHVRIRVGLGSCFAVELVPILLLPTVDLTAQDWDDLYRAPSVSLWTVQVTWRVIQFSVTSFMLFTHALYIFYRVLCLVVAASPTPRRTLPLVSFKFVPQLHLLQQFFPQVLTATLMGK